MAEFAISVAIFEYSRSIFVADLLIIPPAAEIDIGSYTGEPKACNIEVLMPKSILGQ